MKCSVGLAFSNIPRGVHVLTIVAVEDFNFLTVGDKGPRDGAGVDPAALQLGVEAVRVELVDFVQVAEDGVGPGAGVRQVGHRQLVPVEKTHEN